MTMLGDLLAKEDWTLDDRHRIRLEMNKLQTQVSNMSAWMAPGGNLDPNLFLSHSLGFSMLPHECAAMFATTDQTIGDSAETTLVYDAANAATWSSGIKIDPATGYIYVTGIPKETVVLIVGWIAWTANGVGHRRFKWKANDGSSRIMDEQSPSAGTETWQQIVHMRKVPTAHTYYYLAAEQTSGDDLDTLHAGFAITRLR